LGRNGEKRLHRPHLGQASARWTDVRRVRSRDSTAAGQVALIKLVRATARASGEESAAAATSPPSFGG